MGVHPTDIDNNRFWHTPMYHVKVAPGQISEIWDSWDLEICMTSYFRSTFPRRPRHKQQRIQWSRKHHHDLTSGAASSGILLENVWKYVPKFIQIKGCKRCSTQVVPVLCSKSSVFQLSLREAVTHEQTWRSERSNKNPSCFSIYPLYMMTMSSYTLKLRWCKIIAGTWKQQ